MRISKAGSLFAVLLISLLAGCGNDVTSDQPPIERPVKLHTVGSQDPMQTLRFPGSVSAVQQSELAFEVPGRIIEFPVVEGDRVEAGAVLARIDSRDYESERDQALAGRNAALVDFKRYEKAYQAQAIAAQVLDQSRQQLDIASAQLRRAEKAVEDTVLKAPYSGRVARKLVEDFANVQAKQPILAFHSDDAMEMEIQVPESVWVRTARIDSLDDVDFNTHIRVLLSALPEEPIAARLSAFSTAADPVTRTFSATVEFDPPAGLGVSPGMTGHVALDLPADMADAGPYIPAGAVVAAADNSPYVWRYHPDSGAVQKRKVVLGKLSGELVQVPSGLEVGDRIAVSGVHTLAEGDLVRPLEE